MNLKELNIKNLFIGTFILGISIIMGGSYFNLSMPTLIATLLLMLGYFFIGSKVNNNHLISIEQFADSNYFLGFLFTLISLSIALLNLATDNNSMDILINQFGIAILTTLLGLFIRIYLINFTPTEESNREAFDLIIAEKMQLINDQITETIDKNIIFSKVIDEKIYIFSDNTKNMLNDFSMNLIDNLDVNMLKKLIQGITTEMNKTYEEQTKILSNIYTNLEDNQNNYVSNIKIISDSINKNYETIENFNTFMNKVKNSIESYTEEINIASKTLNNNHNTTIEKVDTSILKLDTELTAINSMMVTLVKDLITVNENLLIKISTNNTVNEKVENLLISNNSITENIREKLTLINDDNINKMLSSILNRMENQNGENEIIKNLVILNENINKMIESNSEIKELKLISSREKEDNEK